MTTLVLLRHGETAWNAENRFQGQADIGLNELGWEQARAAAPGIVRLNLDVLYSSPLLRARQTASQVGALGALPIRFDDRLAEIHCGSWSGKLTTELLAENPDLLPVWQSGEDFRRSPTGETEAEVADRVQAALEDIIASNHGKTIGVVGHGLALRAGLARLLGLAQDQALSLGTMFNCCYAVAVHNGVRWRLAIYNSPAEVAGLGGNSHPTQ